MWTDYALSDKGPKVFCYEENYNKWPLVEVERYVYDEEYIEPSLFEEGVHSVSKKIKYFYICTPQ